MFSDHAKETMSTSDADEKYPVESDPVEDGHYDDADSRVAHEDDNDKSNNNNNKGNIRSPSSSWRVVASTIFVVASMFYVALATMDIDEYRFYQDVPASVFYATDDASWWNFYNQTDAYVDIVTQNNATNDTALKEWYNNSFFPEDDYVFQVNETKESTVVTKYMILYFCAAMGFLITGSLEYWLATTVTREMLCLVFILAALFGVASSMMVVANAFLASMFNAVSVHLFALEAISIVIQAFRQRGSDGTGTTTLLWIGHFSFVVGTVMDVVLSYFFIFDLALLPHINASVTAACFWLLTSLIYLWNSVVQARNKHPIESHMKEKSTSIKCTENGDDDGEEISL
jgi:hypothetical protein